MAEAARDARVRERSSALTWFRAGGAGMIVVGLMHLAGQLARTPTDPGFVAMREAMLEYRIHIFGVETSMYAIQGDLNLSYSLFSFVVGAMALASADALSRGGALRRAALVHVVGLLAIVATSAAFRVMPPTIFYAGVTALFGMSALRR